jgi:hypothetical protein
MMDETYNMHGENTKAVGVGYAPEPPQYAPVGVGQSLLDSSGTAVDDDSNSGSGNSLISTGGTALTSGGGNAPIYTGGVSSSGTSAGTDDTSSSIMDTISNNLPLILGGIAVVGGIGAVAYLAHRKHTQGRR